MSKSFKALGLAVGALALTHLPASAQTKITNQGISADEIVIELHKPAVTELVRCGVVVFDVRRVEASGQTAGAFVARGRQPFAISFLSGARVDGRQWRRNPSRFERVRRIRAAADLTEIEIFPGEGLASRTAA